MRSLRTVCLVFICVMLFGNSVLAAEPQSENFQIAHPVGQITSTTLNSSKAMMQSRARGSILSMATLGLSNPGNGVLEVSAMTACHVPVDQISMSVGLFRYDEKIDNWDQMKYDEFHFYAKDYPDQDLDLLMISYDITDQEPGYYYYLSGYHAVWKDGLMQAFGTVTDGIMLTD